MAAGPPIPCLPLVTRADRSPAEVAARRAALAATVANPRARRACRDLLVDDFVAVDDDHYGPLRDLAPVPA